MSAREGKAFGRETAMRKSHISISGLSVLFALGLAAWEVYFFWFAGSFGRLEGKLGWFTPDRLGFNLAWVAASHSRCRRPGRDSWA
jgi:hypothetical protein